MRALSRNIIVMYLYGIRKFLYGSFLARHSWRLATIRSLGWNSYRRKSGNKSLSNLRQSSNQSVYKTIVRVRVVRARFTESAAVVANYTMCIGTIIPYAGSLHFMQGQYPDTRRVTQLLAKARVFCSSRGWETAEKRESRIEKLGLLDGSQAVWRRLCPPATIMALHADLDRFTPGPFWLTPDPSEQKPSTFETVWKLHDSADNILLIL